MPFFQAIWLILTIKCEQSAMLTSASFDRKLTFGERFAVRFHQGYCRKSRRLAEQLVLLETKFREMGNSILEPSDHELAPEAAKRIRTSLQDKMGQK